MLWANLKYLVVGLRVGQADGITPLVMASINGHAEVIQVLLARGAVADRPMMV